MTQFLENYRSLKGMGNHYYYKHMHEFLIKFHAFCVNIITFEYAKTERLKGTFEAGRGLQAC
jgi:hypothetical protein